MPKKKTQKADEGNTANNDTNANVANRTTKDVNEREDNKKKLGITAKKSENFSEWYTQVCSEQGADLVDTRYSVAGFVVHKPWAFRILRRIYDLLDEEVEKDGHEPFLFPTVIPEENLMKEKEHAGFAPDVFWVTHAGDSKLDRRVALRPTGETALYPMYALWIRSHNDLPFKRYQSRITVFRNEKTTRPFLRGREFMFYETHDAFETHEEAMKQIKTDMLIMRRVAFEKLKLPFIFLKRPKWDKFLGAVDTYAGDTIMPDGKRNQMSSTHDLGHNFAKAYDVKFKDKDGEMKYCWQTCFGPGIYRMMAAIIGIHGDDNGLILPSAVAPLQAVIIPITFSKKPEINNKIVMKCRAVEEMINKEGFTAFTDLSEETPGFKFNKWELLGVPLRIEIGPREVSNDYITIINRIEKKKEKINIKDLRKGLFEQLDRFETALWKKADDYFKDNIKDAACLAEVKNIIETHKGFIRAPFCSTDYEGENCAEILKAETIGCYVSGTRLDNPEKASEGQKCIVCKKPAKHIVYIAKSY